MDTGRIPRLTSQRRIILEELKSTPFHPTADEIYARVRERLPRVSLGTIYRNLEMLAARGLIRKLELGGKQRRYEVNLTEHHHVRCIHCGRVADVSLNGPIDLQCRIGSSAGYEICGQRVEFLGVCPECRGHKGLSAREG